MPSSDHTIRIPLHHRGPALWPEAFPLAVLRRIRKALARVLFETVYQGEPSPEAGAIFQAAWFGDYAALPSLLEIGQAWDTATKDGEEHDYSCGVTAGRDADGLIYLLDVWHGQVSVPELQRRIPALAERWRPRWILIEDAGAGSSLLQTLRRLGLPLLAAAARQSKRERALAVTPTVEGGGVRLPASASWREEFLAELLAFPQGRYDDQVDAFVHLLTRFQKASALSSLPSRKPSGW